jgi:ADP-heptose:LPS heptosyltransferase
VLVSGHFEGFRDDAVGGIGVLSENFPVATILYDLIPLLRPSDGPGDGAYREWYRTRIDSLKRSALLLAVSESVRGEALSALGWDADRVVAVLGACDESFSARHLTGSERQALMERLGIARPFVMYAGGADAAKNLPRLIAAYARLPPAVRQTHQLVFVGSMPDSSARQLRQCAAEAGLTSIETVFAGYVPDSDLVALYSSCALFVFPSLHEGFGLPPLEAMACGAVVIGADATSLREVIDLPEARFDPNSTAAIAQKITAGLTDENFRSRLRLHGEVQRSRFSWDQSARRALAAMQTCCEPRRARVSPLLNLVSTGVYKRRELRILIIKLDHIGDFLLSIPALTKLRVRYPYASIDAVVGSWNLAAARSLGLFKEVFSYDLLKRTSPDAAPIEQEDPDALVRQLPGYDIAIDLRRFPESRFLLHRINADLKVGYQTLDPAVDEVMHIALPVYPEARSVTTPLNVISQASQMVALIDALPTDVNDFVTFPPVGIVGDPEPGTIALFPKAGNPVREWCAENFRELVDLLIGNERVQRLNIYVGSEVEVGEFGLVNRDKLRVHVGLAFPELTRSLSRNALCLANNSGGAHLASYLGVNVLAIYSGHELPSEWAPVYHTSYVLHRAAECAPCHLGEQWHCPNGLYCLQDIAIFDVYAKAIEALAQAESGSQVAPQCNDDALVKRLLASITALGPMHDESVLRSLATAIAMNHPTYRMNPDLTGRNLDEVIDHSSSRIDWQGFSGSEEHFRWTDGTAATIRFIYHGTDRIAGQTTLKLLFDTLGRQRVIARLNGRRVSDSKYQGSNITLLIPGKHLKFGTNVLEFALPDARVPGGNDMRRLAIAVKSLTLPMRDAPAIQRVGG